MADYLCILLHTNSESIKGISYFPIAAQNLSIHSLPYILVDMLPHYFQVATILRSIFATGIHHTHHVTPRDSSNLLIVYLLKYSHTPSPHTYAPPT